MIRFTSIELAATKKNKVLIIQEAYIKILLKDPDRKRESIIQEIMSKTGYSRSQIYKILKMKSKNEEKQT